MPHPTRPPQKYCPCEQKNQTQIIRLPAHPVVCNSLSFNRTAFNQPKELCLTLDITEEIAVVSYEPDDEVKEKKNITLTTEVIPFYLEKLDQTAAENGGHLALGKVSFITRSKIQVPICKRLLKWSGKMFSH